MEPLTDRLAVVTTYEEYAPCLALRPFVRAIFAYRPGVPRASERRAARHVPIVAGAPFRGPTIATAGAAIVVPLGEICIDGRWSGAGSGAESVPLLIGPSTRSLGSAPRALPAMVGAYLRPDHLSAFVRTAGECLADQVKPLREVLGVATNDIVAGFERFATDGDLIEVERALFRRFSAPSRIRGRFDIASVLRCVAGARGALRVAHVADAAGVSRQHLSRLLREHTGLAAKAISRLARFHGTLAHLSRRADAGWSGVAAECGYADQSHMIREFRRLSGCTPAELLGPAVFHPFVRRLPCTSANIRF